MYSLRAPTKFEENWNTKNVTCNVGTIIHIYTHKFVNIRTWMDPEICSRGSFNFMTAWIANFAYRHSLIINKEILATSWTAEFIAVRSPQRYRVDHVSLTMIGMSVIRSACVTECVLIMTVREGDVSLRDDEGGGSDWVRIEYVPGWTTRSPGSV